MLVMLETPKRRPGTGTIQRERSGRYRARLPGHCSPWLPGTHETWEAASEAIDAATREGAAVELTAAARLTMDTSFVYFVKDLRTGAIKIGVAKDPKRRLVQMQSGSVGRLRLLAVMPGSFATEKALHAAFAPQRINGGEWFDESPVLMRLIAEWSVGP